MTSTGLPLSPSHDMFSDSMKKNIVVFTWHSSKNVMLIVPFLNYLSQYCGHNCHVVTTDATGKFRLIQSGFPAYTVNEILLAYAANDREADAEDEVPAEHSPLDLNLNWLYTPQDPALLSSPGRSNSRGYYFWKRRQLITSYSRFLAELGADAVFTWNGALLVAGSLAEAARKLSIPKYYMERGLLPHSLVIDAGGVNSDSVIAGSHWQRYASPPPSSEELDTLKEYCSSLQRSGASIVNSGQRKDTEAVLKELELKPDKPIVLLPLQIESDSNIQNNSPFYKSMEYLIQDVRNALANLDAQLIVKPHPEDKVRREVIESLCNAPNVSCCWDLSLQSLLPITDMVVVINSTVGLEALLQNKTVIALGRSIYDRKGFTIDLTGDQSLAALLSGALTTKMSPYDNPDFWLFLKTLISQHTFFFEEQDGLTDAKPQIAEDLQLAGSGDLESIHTKAIERFQADNALLARFLQGNYDKSCVVIGPLDTVMNPIDDSVTLLNRKTSPIVFLKALLRKHDLMICMEWPSNRILGTYFRMLRARKTIILG